MIENIIEIEAAITVDNLPKGTWWDEHCGSWKAKILHDNYGGRVWHWQAQNMEALAQGKPTGEMTPYIQILTNIKGERPCIKQ